MILGGGVAGLSAAICARRAGWDAVVVERRERGETSARNAHVHRLPLESQAQLVMLLGDAVQMGAEDSGRLGSARNGRLNWDGCQPLTSLTELETALVQAAIDAGVLVEFGREARALSATGKGWHLDVESGHTFEADMLIDATGAHRAVFALLGDQAPDVPLDDIDAPERHVSWQGLAAKGDPVLIAWSNTVAEGLLQVDATGRARLTARAGSGADLTPASVEAAMRASGGEALANRNQAIRYEPRGVRHTSSGARRVALEEADLSGLPPFALIGDALIEASPRYGEGVGRAVKQALMLGGLLREGKGADCADVLARQAKAHWAGYGVALSLRRRALAE